MFQFEIDPSALPITLEDSARLIYGLLKEIIPEELYFEDSSDFLSWAEDSFPFIRAKNDPLSETAHIIIFSRFSPEFCAEYYSALLKKSRLPRKTFQVLLFNILTSA